MTKRALELIPEYVLGTLPDSEKRALEQELEVSPDLRAEVAATTEAYAALAERLQPVAPAPSVKKRLLESIASPAERFAPMAGKLSAYFDLAVDKVRELLAQIYDPATKWEAGPLPGIFTFDFEAGPKVQPAHIGFVKLPAGLHFPWHRHHGPEVNFVMKGRIKDFDGRIYGPGEGIEKEGGTEHEFWVLDEDVLLAVVLSGFDIIPKP